MTRLAVHDLSVGDPTPASPTVLAIHGITANGRTWPLVADLLAGLRAPDTVRFLAPDLAGRGDSPLDGEHHGLADHVTDLLAIIETLPAPPVVAGHSMGAFVGALLAAEHPRAVAGLVLVDGGLSLPAPTDLDIDAALQQLLGPALDRLQMTFASEAAYLSFLAAHPAVGPLVRGPRRALVEGYLRHDCRPVTEPDGTVRYRSSGDLAAVRADGADVLADRQLSTAVQRAAAHRVPTEFLWAERGLLDQTPGLYDEQRLRDLDVPPEVRVTRVADTNHYSIILDEPGALEIARAVDRRLPH